MWQGWRVYSGIRVWMMVTWALSSTTRRARRLQMKPRPPVIRTFLPWKGVFMRRTVRTYLIRPPGCNPNGLGRPGTGACAWNSVLIYSGFSRYTLQQAPFQLHENRDADGLVRRGDGLFREPFSQGAGQAGGGGSCRHLGPAAGFPELQRDL